VQRLTGNELVPLLTRLHRQVAAEAGQQHGIEMPAVKQPWQSAASSWCDAAMLTWNAADFTPSHLGHGPALGFLNQPVKPEGWTDRGSPICPTRRCSRVMSIHIVLGVLGMRWFFLTRPL
jgi:hypothetical protein